MSDKKFIVLVDDRLLPSICRDLVSALSLALPIYLGVLLESSAMQWIFGTLAVLTLLARMANTTKAKFTIDEARAELNKLESSQ